MNSYVEWIGYFASFMVMCSFLFKDIIKLRMINMVGCAGFIVYGALLAPLSWPIVITNVFIFSINFYYLFLKKLYKLKSPREFSDATFK